MPASASVAVIGDPTTSLAAPGLAAPLAAPGLAAPLATSGFAAPLAASGFAAPLAASGLAAPLAASGLAAPLTLTLTLRPVAAPLASPVASPLAALPLAALPLAALPLAALPLAEPLALPFAFLWLGSRHARGARLRRLGRTPIARPPRAPHAPAGTSPASPSLPGHRLSEAVVARKRLADRFAAFTDRLAPFADRLDRSALPALTDRARAFDLADALFAIRCELALSALVIALRAFGFRGLEALVIAFGALVIAFGFGGLKALVIALRALVIALRALVIRGDKALVIALRAFALRALVIRGDKVFVIALRALVVALRVLGALLVGVPLVGVAFVRIAFGELLAALFVVLAGALVDRSLFRLVRRDLIAVVVSLVLHRVGHVGGRRKLDRGLVRGGLLFIERLPFGLDGLGLAGGFGAPVILGGVPPMSGQVRLEVVWSDQIFHVEEGGALEPHVDERGLHAGKHAAHLAE
ncbi:MAG: hypothetical protein L6Q76_26640, partial [Polyangiaceae bacterium]|nr:hypothetical protein [Polyangiaceae bacterium]